MPDVDYSIYHHLHVIDMNKCDIRFDELQTNISAKHFLQAVLDDDTSFMLISYDLLDSKSMIHEILQKDRNENRHDIFYQLIYLDELS